LSLRRTCPKCQARNAAGAERCVECGARLEAGDAVVAHEDTGTVIPSTPPDGDAEEGTLVPVGGADHEGGDDSHTILPSEVRAATPGGVSPPPSPATPPPAGSAGRLEIGSVLGGRYRIEKMLGMGGMGAVYRATDLELDRDVALKVIRPELEADEALLQRFKQEIILAREITHRNVVRTFDLGQADGIRFISMEFVEGTDLSDVIRDKGALPPDEAVEIVEQICLALDAAHSEGVVHRDLKPHNVMLAADGRVVVMDFGIARSLQASSMTQTGAMLGTPDYMSPEQVKGESVDARADLFALGVMFYQMLTGVLPYSGDTPMATMYKRTQERAKPVRDHTPEIPGFLSDVVQRCLEIQPHKRYQSAREILQDLNVWRGGTAQMTFGHTMRAIRPTTTKGRNWVRYAAIGGAAVIAIALVAWGLTALRSGPAEDEQAAAVAAVPPEDIVSLAVVPFRNATGNPELAWLETGLADMLRTEIGQSPSLRIASPDRVHQILRDLRITPGATLEEVTLRRIAEFANADTVVWGQFVRLGETYRIDVTVRDFARHTTEPLTVEADGETQLLAAVSDMAEGVRSSLDLSRERIAELERDAFVPSTASFAALRDYTEGLEQLRAGNNLDAAASFQNAIEADPDFALAHGKLAMTELELGRRANAQDASRRAVELSDDLPPAERFAIVAQDARIDGDYERGLDAYTNLLRLHPNDPEAHYELALLQEEAGEFEEAEQHLGTALAADPRNVTAQLALGRVLIKSGATEDALAPLNQAMSLAIQSDNDEAKANTLQALGIAYSILDRQDDALENFQESLAIKREIGDREGMAASLSEIAYIQELSGDPDAARSTYLEALDLRREVSDDAGVGRLLMNLGDLERAQGNDEQALQYVREALRILMESGDKVNQALALHNLGTIYDQRGEYSESLVYYQQALDLLQDSGSPYDTAETLHNLAVTHAALGRLQNAQDRYLEALDVRRNAADEVGAAYESQGLAEVFAAEGRYAAALEAIEEARTTFERLEVGGSMRVELVTTHGDILARLGRFDEATERVDEALELARSADDPVLETSALLAAGDLAIYAGDLSGAVSRYREAAASAASTGDPRLVATVRIDQGRGAVMQGRHREALSILEPAVAEARRRGLEDLEAAGLLWSARAHLGLGDTAAAEEPARSAVRLAEKIGLRVELLQARWALAEVLRAAGNAAEAQRLAAAAVASLDEIAAEAGSATVRDRADLATIVDATTP
jgi:tetratricopeptide (TPR) repeat protein/predicted Ser/Thr protein kinase/TolB-like protein